MKMHRNHALFEVCWRVYTN